MDNAAENNVVGDVLSAFGVNVIALVVGYPLAIVLPTFLIIALPFGVFWVYVVLVGVYAVSQFRKGRKRRAIVAGAFAVILLIALAMNTRIA